MHDKIYNFKFILCLRLWSPVQHDENHLHSTWAKSFGIWRDPCLAQLSEWCSCVLKCGSPYFPILSKLLLFSVSQFVVMWKFVAIQNNSSFVPSKYFSNWISLINLIILPKKSFHSLNTGMFFQCINIYDDLQHKQVSSQITWVPTAYDTWQNIMNKLENQSYSEKSLRHQQSCYDHLTSRVRKFPADHLVAG